LIPKSSSLNGKVCVITGASGVLCGHFAKELSRQGMKVCILDINEEKGLLLKEEILNNDGEASFFYCNVLDEDSIKNAREEIINKYGKIDVLINGAGGNSPLATTTNEIYSKEDVLDKNIKSFIDLEKKGFSFVFDLNFIGTVLPSQVFTEDLIKTSGVILNISSMSAPSPMTKVPAYSAAKAAINNFTQWMAVHLAESGVRVNAIAPGFFLTAQNKQLLTQDDGSLTERSGKIISHTPMRRFGNPDDLLGSVVFLLDSDMSGFITGTVLPIDGGFMAYSGV
jgi:NAD(P)-dependent dehydrogenase (short-subunit alcohol dehydrogenase family)